MYVHSGRHSSVADRARAIARGTRFTTWGSDDALGVMPDEQHGAPGMLAEEIVKERPRPRRDVLVALTPREGRPDTARTPRIDVSPGRAVQRAVVALPEAGIDPERDIPVLEGQLGGAARAEQIRTDHEVEVAVFPAEAALGALLDSPGSEIGIPVTRGDAGHVVGAGGMRAVDDIQGPLAFEGRSDAQGTPPRPPVGRCTGGGGWRSRRRRRSHPPRDGSGGGGVYGRPRTLRRRLRLGDGQVEHDLVVATIELDGGPSRVTAMPGDHRLERRRD